MVRRLRLPSGTMRCLRSKTFWIGNSLLANALASIRAFRTMLPAGAPQIRLPGSYFLGTWITMTWVYTFIRWFTGSFLICIALFLTMRFCGERAVWWPDHFPVRFSLWQKSVQNNFFHYLNVVWKMIALCRNYAGTLLELLRNFSCCKPVEGQSRATVSQPFFYSSERLFIVFDEPLYNRFSLC